MALSWQQDRGGPTVYSAFGLLKPDSDFTMAEAAARFAAKFPSFAVNERPGLLVVLSEDWEIHVTLNGSPAVLDESRDMAERIGGAEDGKDLVVCDRRVELASDVPDPEMAHFDDYLRAVEVLKSFKGLIAVDPSEPALL
jgi:hypothetical protein